MAKKKLENKQLLAREYLIEFKERYSDLEKLEIRYRGEGDSFEDFYDWELIGEEISKRGFKEQGKIYDDIYVKFEEIIWEIIEKMGANFNNEGSEGRIIMDFEKGTIYADNYDIVRTEEFNTDIDYLGNIQEDDAEQ